jgi:signal transduction histidine kinase
MDVNLILIYFSCIGLNFILGTIIYFNNPTNGNNKAFSFLCLSQIVWMLSLYLLYINTSPYNPASASVFVKLAYGSSVLMAFGVVNFFYFFPFADLMARKIYKKFFLIITVLILFLATFTPLIHEALVVENNIYVNDILGPVYPFYVLYIIFSILAAGYFAIKKIISISGIKRKKLTIAAIGCGVYGVSTLIINVILPTFHVYIFEKKAVVFSLFFTLATFYSFFRHRFFNISYAALNFLRGMILFIGFVLIMLSTNYALDIFVQNINYVVKIIISSGLGIIAFVIMERYIPLFSPMSFLKLQEAIKRLKISLLNSDSFKDLQEKLENEFEIGLNISNVKIFIVRKENAHIGVPVYIKDNFTKILSIIDNDALLSDEIAYMDFDAAKEKFLSGKMKHLGANFIMPLFSEKNLTGFLVLGPRDQNSLYSKEEIAEILLLKPQIETAVMNLLVKLHLQEENNLMKRIINGKTENLRKQFQEIKQLLRQQSDFLAITAHEFRTPLSIALFQLEDTLYNHRHSPDVVKDMEIMEKSLKNLKDLTQKLFDVQQYDLKKVTLNKEETNIKEFIAQTYNDFLNTMKEKKIAFSLSDKIKMPLYLKIDTSQMRQVMHNLLHNAIKFTDKKRPSIKIELKADKKNVFISVIDNGKGIQDDDKMRIFEKFQTVKASMGMGMGLGLYICKKIIELHKGKILAEDAHPHGAQISIELSK